MDDYDEEFLSDYGDESAINARRFQPSDLAVLGLDFMRGVLQSTARTLMYAQVLAAGHANFKTMQAQFHEEAALEIETITGETDG